MYTDFLNPFKFNQINEQSQNRREEKKQQKQKENTYIFLFIRDLFWTYEDIMKTKYINITTFKNTSSSLRHASLLSFSSPSLNSSHFFLIILHLNQTNYCVVCIFQELKASWHLLLSITGWSKGFFPLHSILFFNAQKIKTAL